MVVGDLPGLIGEVSSDDCPEFSRDRLVDVADPL